MAEFRLEGNAFVSETAVENSAACPTQVAHSFELKSASSHPRFEQCILHIGTEKTGTTTLQTVLHENRKILAERQYVVPTSLSPYPALANHERLTTCSLRADKLTDDLRVAAGLKTAGDIFEHRKHVRDQLHTEHHTKISPGAILLLSNEHCHSRLTSEDEVKYLYSFLSEFAKNVKIVVYLRPQHELAMSAYDQALKAGHCDIDILPDFKSGRARWIERRYFDYADLINRWSSVFGQGNLSVRIFGREELLGGSIVHDFLKVIACNPDGLEVAQNENLSMSEPLQRVLNAINRFEREHPGSVNARTRKRIISVFQGISRGLGARPSRSDAVRFYLSFADSNEEVRQLFFGERPSLFNINFGALPAVAEPRSEADDIIATLIKIIESI